MSDSAEIRTRRFRPRLLHPEERATVPYAAVARSVMAALLNLDIKRCRFFINRVH
jgi:hypothetical protein